MTVTDVMPDAWPLVSARGGFTGPPSAGRQFFMATLTVNNVGTYASTFDEGHLSVAGGTTSTIYDDWDYSCGIIHPGENLDSARLPREIQVPAKTLVTLEVCWEVDQADAPTLRMDWYEIWLSLN